VIFKLGWGFWLIGFKVIFRVEFEKFWADFLTDWGFLGRLGFLADCGYFLHIGTIFRLGIFGQIEFF